MRFSGGSRLLFSVLAVLFSTATPARAWTRTIVHSASARVEVEADATLQVLLRLDVEVHAGWLHELELVDLGSDVELDRDYPPYFRSDEGEVFRPEAQLRDDGRIRLSFPRREAPRRGEYRVYIRYRTGADVSAVEVEGQRRARVVWSVPAWETGLHDVSVEFRAPKGSRVPDKMLDASPGVSVQVTEAPRRTLIRWRRIHVPRLTAWPLALDAPGESIALPTDASTPPPPIAFRPLPTPMEHPIAWVTFAIALLALIKRRVVELKLGRQQLWLDFGWPTALVAVSTIAGTAQFLAPTHLAWGLPLILLALHRPLRKPTPPEARTWAQARFDRNARELMLAPLDGTTALGALTLLTCSAGFFAIGEPKGALLLLPLFFTGTRHHGPPSSSEARRILSAFVSSLRVPEHAPPMGFVWERANDGAHRVRIELSNARTGLLSVSFVVTSSSTGFLRERSVMLLVRTRTQSDADDLMRRREHGGNALRAVDGSIARLVPWSDEAIELLRVLARRVPKTTEASRGTWLLRELAAPDRKAA
jgi:hypothetical protein